MQTRNIGTRDMKSKLIVISWGTLNACANTQFNCNREREPFEWFQNFSGIKKCVFSNVNKGDKVLYVGCGTSRVPEKMEKNGYTDVTCIDFSEECITQMKEKYASHSALTCTNAFA